MTPQGATERITPVWRKAMLLAAAYALAIGVMTWPFVNWSALASAWHEGDAGLMIWTLAWNNHAMLSGLPVFDANIFHPASQSLRYNDPMFAVAAFALPIYVTTGNPVLAYNLVWLLAFVLSCLASRALILRLSGSEIGAFAGSLAFAFSFYVMLHALGHLSLIWTWPLPLSLLLFERWHERPTLLRAAAWGGVLLLQILSAWYIGTIALAANAMLVVWRLAATHPSRWLSKLWHLLPVGAVAAAIVIPLAAPYRSIERPDVVEVARFSADWPAYLVPPQNTWVGQWWLAHLGEGPRWIYEERTLFLGYVAMILAGIGVVVAMRRGGWRVHGAYVLIALVGLGMSFGPDVGPEGERLSLFGLAANLPGVEAMRAPARFSLLVVLGVAVMAGHGVSAIARVFGRRGVVLVGLLLPLMLSEWFVVNLPGGKPRPKAVPEIYASEHVRQARAIVSLPEYRETPTWYLGADYLVYSTLHWRPIVNGFGRTEPEGHARIANYLQAFPGPNNARMMREIGVDVIVFHAGRYPDGAKDLLREAIASSEYELVEQIGSDYLFRIGPSSREP